MFSLSPSLSPSLPLPLSFSLSFSLAQVLNLRMNSLSLSLFLSFSLSLFLSFSFSLSLSLSLSSHRSMIHLLLTHQGGKVRKRKKPWKRSKEEDRLRKRAANSKLSPKSKAASNRERRVKRIMKDRNVSRKAAQKVDDARHFDGCVYTFVI